MKGGNKMQNEIEIPLGVQKFSWFILTYRNGKRVCPGKSYSYLDAVRRAKR